MARGLVSSSFFGLGEWAEFHSVLHSPYSRPWILDSRHTCAYTCMHVIAHVQRTLYSVHVCHIKTVILCRLRVLLAAFMIAMAMTTAMVIVMVIVMVMVNGGRRVGMK